MIAITLFPSCRNINNKKWKHESHKYLRHAIHPQPPSATTAIIISLFHVNLLKYFEKLGELHKPPVDATYL